MVYSDGPACYSPHFLRPRKYPPVKTGYWYCWCVAIPFAVSVYFRLSILYGRSRFRPSHNYLAPHRTLAPPFPASPRLRFLSPRALGFVSDPAQLKFTPQAVSVKISVIFLLLFYCCWGLDGSYRVPGRSHAHRLGGAAPGHQHRTDWHHREGAGLRAVEVLRHRRELRSQV